MGDRNREAVAITMGQFLAAEQLYDLSNARHPYEIVPFLRATVRKSGKFAGLRIGW